MEDPKDQICPTSNLDHGCKYLDLIVYRIDQCTAQLERLTAKLNNGMSETLTRHTDEIETLRGDVGEIKDMIKSLTKKAFVLLIGLVMFLSGFKGAEAWLEDDSKDAPAKPAVELLRPALPSR